MGSQTSRDGERWVLWTPEGFFDASPGADALIGYRLNRGPQQAAEVVVEVPDRGEALPRLHVLAAGITRYRDSSLHLRYAAADASAVARELERRASKLFSGVEVHILSDQEVTKDALMRSFRELGGQMAPQDVFILCLAGHGEVRNGRYLFLPADLVYESEQTPMINLQGMDFPLGLLDE